MSLAYAPIDAAPFNAPPHLTARTLGPAAATRPVLPVLGQVDAVCGQLVQAARLAGLRPVLCAHPEQALARALAARAEMVLVQEAALQRDAAETLFQLRAAGTLRVVLVGPAFGSFGHGRALHQGYDEVWPAGTPVTLLALMLGKAHGSTPALESLAEMAAAASSVLLPVPRADAAPPAPWRLQVDVRTGRCRWGAQMVKLTRSSAVLLQGLLSAYPHDAARASLALTLPGIPRSGPAGLAAPGKQRHVDTRVSRLRSELAAGGLGALQIVSVRCLGYRLVLPA